MYKITRGIPVATNYQKTAANWKIKLTNSTKRVTLPGCRSIHVYFDHLRCITQDDMVAELLQLFKAGLLPMSMAAPLGEKERAAAFSEEDPLAWIDICPPADASTATTTTMFGYPCQTRRSFMLRVVGRGSISNPASWITKKADFVQHGQLALIRQAFPRYFKDMHVGISLNLKNN